MARCMWARRLSEGQARALVSRTQQRPAVPRHGSPVRTQDRPRQPQSHSVLRLQGPGEQFLDSSDRPGAERLAPGLLTAGSGHGGEAAYGRCTAS